MKYKWKYSGPVMEFDRLICVKWEGETTAVSEKQAKNNLSYQFKKNNNRAKNAKITLHGKLTQLEAVMD